MQKLYLVTRSELPSELPAEIIRGFVSEKSVIEFFMGLTGAPISTIDDVIDNEMWVTNQRLLDDNCFYGIIQTELYEF